MPEQAVPTAPMRLRLSRRQFVKLTGLAGTGLVIAWSSACTGGGSTDPASTPTSAPNAAPTTVAGPSASPTASSTVAPAASQGPGAATAIPSTAPAAAPTVPARTTPPTPVARNATPRDVDAWLSIGEDGTITLASGKVEFGQGIQTGFAQLATEELDVPLARISVVMGQTNRVPVESSTVGSQSTRGTGPTIRQAAAEMRQWLRELGAEKLGVPVAQVATQDGVVLVAGDPARKATYAELAASKLVGRPVSGQAKLKDPEGYTIVGQRLPRLDVPDKVTGATKFGYDAMVPGMLHGKVLRAPSLGATLESVDISAAVGMPGVAGVLRDGDFVGLAAEHVEQAEAALAAIEATWKERGSAYTSENIHAALKATKDQGRVVGNAGDAAKALGRAAKRVQAVFKAPYVTHGQIEPMTALVQIQPDKTEVWTSTQNPFGVQRTVAQTLDLPSERVIVYPLMSGGAFGRKSITDEVAVEAARLARHFGRPVRVNWTRAEEFQLGRFRPAMLIEVAAGLNDRNELVAWQYDLYASAYYPEGANATRQSGAGQHANLLDFYRKVPNAKTTFYQGVSPLPPHFWRNNGGTINTLARESVIDELAELAGQDPVTFRAGLLADNPRLLAVLRAAVELAGWQPGIGATGQGVGVAVAHAEGTYIAEIARVAVDRATGKVTVQHFDVALDCGLVVNPAAVEAQVEGSIVMQGTSPTLKEAITFANGRVTNATFAEYDMLTFTDAPTVSVTFVEDKTQPMQGVGEPAVDPASAAIANAIYDAIGVRLRELPFTPDRVLAALRGGGRPPKSPNTGGLSGFWRGEVGGEERRGWETPPCRCGGDPPLKREGGFAPRPLPAREPIARPCANCLPPLQA